MPEYGLVIKSGTDSTRLEAQCAHQSGLLYIVPGEASWVCTQELRHAHTLAGFFKELTKLQDPHIKELMQRWGLYFRELPLEPQEAGATEAKTKENPS
ncbi:MAG: hypothetical protein HYY31_01135 [Chloroflexi bacterium]|nr:hypothetical protein [Chloroflexota bacterium]